MTLREEMIAMFFEQGFSLQGSKIIPSSIIPNSYNILEFYRSETPVINVVIPQGEIKEKKEKSS